MVKLDKIVQKIGIIIQRIIIIPSLFIIYFVGFGITLILVFLFSRKMLVVDNKKSTFWIDAEDYEIDIDNATRES
jgi:hypothetical protein